MNKILLHRYGVGSDVAAARPEPEVEVATGSRHPRATRWSPNNRDFWRRWKTRFPLHLVSTIWPSMIISFYHVLL